MSVTEIRTSNFDVLADYEGDVVIQKKMRFFWFWAVRCGRGAIVQCVNVTHVHSGQKDDQSAIRAEGGVFNLDTKALICDL